LFAKILILHTEQASTDDNENVWPPRPLGTGEVKGKKKIFFFQQLWKPALYLTFECLHTVIFPFDRSWLHHSQAVLQGAEVAKILFFGHFGPLYHGPWVR